MKVCFLLWSPDISGGTNVIFEHATRLVEMGVDVTIVTHDSVSSERLSWFPGSENLAWRTFDQISAHQFDVAIATWWRTVFSLHLVSAKKYVYFVQSIESKFYPEGEVFLRNTVDMTYMLGLNIITEATWIKSFLEKNYGCSVHLVRNGIRKEYFFDTISPIEDRQENKFRLLVEGPLGVSFKNTELAVELAKKSNADEVWLLTSTEIAYYSGVDRLFSRVPISEVGAIYASCDAILKLSTVEGMFGPPLEAFHCGATSISYDVTGFDEYIVDGKNALVSFSRKDEDVIEKINCLASNKDKLNALKDNALITARAWPSWDISSKAFMEACSDISCNGNGNITSSVLEYKTAIIWSSYEESLRRLSSMDTGLSTSFKGKIAHYIMLKSPRVFSYLRRALWAYRVSKMKATVLFQRCLKRS